MSEEDDFRKEIISRLDRIEQMLSRMVPGEPGVDPPISPEELARLVAAKGKGVLKDFNRGRRWLGSRRSVVSIALMELKPFMLPPWLN